jgi:hypothetical protein
LIIIIFYYKFFPRIFVIIILGQVTWSCDLYYEAFSLANNIESRTYRSFFVYIYNPDFAVILGLDFLAKIICIVYSICLVLVYINPSKINIFVLEITSISITIIYRSYNNQVPIYFIKQFIISWIFGVSNTRNNYYCF